MMTSLYLVAQILYTGDFSCQEDRHLCSAEIPNVHPDICITVSMKIMLANVVQSSSGLKTNS